MPGETTPTGAGTQADSDQSSQADTAQGGQGDQQQQPQAGGQQGTPDNSDGEETISLEEARRLRSENQNLRRRLKPLEDADKKRQQESQSAEERLAALERERDSALEQIRRERVERRVLSIAVQQGAVDPDAVVRLIDQDEIEFDADGKPTNVDSLVKALLRSKPYLTKATTKGSADGGAGTSGGNRGQGDFNSMIRRAAGRE